MPTKKSRQIKNPRAQLSIATPVLERLKWEVEFLNLNSKVMAPDPDGPQSRGDIIRRAVELYIDFCEAGGSHHCEYEERDSCSFYFAKFEIGRWEYAVSQHFAASYHELATLALDWYFLGIDTQEECDRATYEALKRIPFRELETVLKSGRIEDAIQAAGVSI